MSTTSERLAATARETVKAFYYSKGDDQRQRDFFRKRIKEGKTHPSTLDVTGQQLLENSESRRIILDAFRRKHPRIYLFLWLTRQLDRRVIGQINKGIPDLLYPPGRRD